MKSKVEGICDVCGGPLFQRPDEEAKRLGHSDTKPLLDYYDAKGLLVNFNSLVGSEDLFDE